jgi:carbamoyltransferase
MNIIGFSGFANSIPFKKKEFPRLSERHYRIAQGFDSAAALVTSSGIQAAAAEERFTGEKATGAFPYNAILNCLQSSGLRLDSIDYLAHSFAYDSFQSIFENGEYTQRQFAEIYSREVQIRTLQKYFPSLDWNEKFIQVPHHLSHAASTFYVSGFEDALILIADGMGELHSTTIAVGTKDRIKVIKQIPAFHSLGLLYGVLTQYLGFWFGLDEYKVMGLAPYGKPERYFNQFMDFIHLKDDGTYSIPILFKNQTLQEKETYDGTISILQQLFGPSREPETEITQNHMDIAAALQASLETCLLHILQHFQQETGLKNLCMAGGVALNCTANGRIFRSGLFRELFIQPAAGDDGSALGAALYVQRHYDQTSDRRRMTLPFWGPEYSTEMIDRALQQRPELEWKRYSCFDDLARETAERLVRGEIVGWFQGAMEFGPRALGNRSILADPRDANMRQRINSKIKKREEFRPFAPAVMEEEASKYFEIPKGSESIFTHMLFVAKVKSDYRQKFPATTHVDGSARVQTVFKHNHPRFWTLLSEFHKASGFPILLNTSFNVRAQPIVRSPQEAVETFIQAELDALVMEDYLIVRSGRMEHLQERSSFIPEPGKSMENAEAGRPAIFQESASKQPFVGPRSALETTVVRIWSEILGLERISIHDNFFELGGHSLLVAQVLYRLRDELNMQIPMRTLFNSPTVAKLAANISKLMQHPDSKPGKS